MRKTDGISTEPDTWKGYENIANQLTSVGRLRIGIRRDALSAKEAFHMGYSYPASLALTLPEEAASIPLHLALIFTCLLIIGSTGATEVTLW